MSSGELVIHIPGSKTDIYDDGYKLNIKLRAGDTPSGIGPLLLLRRLYSLNPARLGANASPWHAEGSWSGIRSMRHSGRQQWL